MGISGVIHLVAVSLYPSFVTRIPQAVRATGDAPARLDPRGTELVNLVELSEDQEAELLPPVQEEPEVPVIPVDVRPTGVVAPPGPEDPVEEDPGLTAAERIRPKAGDHLPGRVGV